MTIIAITSTMHIIRMATPVLSPIVLYYTYFMAFFKNFNKKRIYLDVASSTPIDKDMLKDFPKLNEDVLMANPSSLHKEGVLARSIINKARKLVAGVLSAHDSEIIFTSGATESDNLAILGAVDALASEGISKESILVYQSAFEHSAVSETTSFLKRNNTQVRILPIENGIIDPKDIKIPAWVKAVIVSIIYVNNEVGTVQPIKEIAKRIRFLRKHNPNIKIIFHIDATQAPSHFNLNVQSLGIDMMTLGSTKLYCPKGLGLLYIKKGIKVEPRFFGGGQEFGIRPGTESVYLIHNFAHALKYAQDNLEKENKKISEIREYFENLLKKEIPEAVITFESAFRTPHISHIAIKDIDSELLVLELDAKGIAVSAKSACKNEDSNESQVVLDVHGTDYGAIRFSFGRFNKKEDAYIAVSVLRKIIDKYKN